MGRQNTRCQPFSIVWDQSSRSSTRGEQSNFNLCMHNVGPSLVCEPPPPPQTVEAGFRPVYTVHGVYVILVGRSSSKFKRDSDRP